MTIDDVALRVSAALGTAGVPFMLVGGFSSNYYGIPRSTKDADFLVQLNAPLNEAFARTLGPEFEAEPQWSFETNTGLAGGDSSHGAETLTLAPPRP